MIIETEHSGKTNKYDCDIETLSSRAFEDGRYVKFFQTLDEFLAHENVVATKDFLEASSFKDFVIENREAGKFDLSFWIIWDNDQFFVHEDIRSEQALNDLASFFDVSRIEIN